MPRRNRASTSAGVGEQELLAPSAPAHEPDDFSDADWKGSVADSVASGYVSRARAWGLIEMKLAGGKYALTPAGEKTLKKFSAGKVA